MKAILSKNLDTLLTINGLAKMVALNTTKLKLGFKKIYGTTVYGYVRRLRIEEARKLLEEDKLTVSEVAGKLGYRSLSHFTVAFKREFLCTPSTYRKEHTGKHKIWGKRMIILKNSFTVNYLSKLNFTSI